MKKGIILFLFAIGIVFPIYLMASDTNNIVNGKSSTTEGTTMAQAPTIACSVNKLTTKGNDSLVIGDFTDKKGVKLNVQSVNPTEEKNIQEAPYTSTLLNYILEYNTDSTMVHPRTALVVDSLSEDDLEFPDMNLLYMPLVFNNISRVFKVEWKDEQIPSCPINSAPLDSLLSEIKILQYCNDLTRKVITSAETNLIGNIRYDQKNLPKPEKLIYHLDSGQPDAWLGSFKPVYDGKPDEYVLPQTQYNPWTTKCNLKLQFSQTYISPNWSAGGESNMAGLATFHLDANYSDLKKIEFDNSIDAKIGLNTVSSDTLRNLNISTDQLRIVSKLGVRMRNNLYYSLSGEFNSQFLNNYATNTMTLRSAFLSPATLYVGLGVDYKKSGKGYALSVLLAPLTYKMNYLNDIKDFNVSSYGIKDGHHFGNELGSKLSATLGWKLSDNVNWTSNYYYYTNFTYIDTNWENTLDISLNSYFSTQIYIHTKLDDRLARNHGQPLVQMLELLSFGFSYHW